MTRHRPHGRGPWVTALVVLTVTALPLAGWAAAGPGDAPGSAGDGAMTLRSACDTKVLTVTGAGLAPLKASAPTGAATQLWTLTAGKGGVSTLASAADGRVADVQGARTAVRTPVVAWTAHGGANQQWKVVPVSGDVVRLEPRSAPGTVLGLVSGTARLVKPSNSCRSKWRFVAAPTEGTPATEPPATEPPATEPPAKPPVTEPPATGDPGTVSAGGTLRNRMPGMGMADTLVIPKGSPGHAEERIQKSASDPKVSDIGASRFPCEMSHMGFDDPIVKPGKPGTSHLHVFFGNTGTNAASTPDSVATTGNGTCHGGTANRSAYWVPALYDTRTGQPLAPTFAIMYYKTGYQGVKPKDVQPLPTHLRIVAGSTDATGSQPYMGWGCLSAGGKVESPGTIPVDCAPAKEALQLSVQFPQCWDGKNLDSPDHKSHMAYPIGEEGCPASHPVGMSTITINVRYAVDKAGDTRFYRLSSDMYDTSIPGGRSLHGDWMNGWDPKVQKIWVDNCQNRSLNCNYELGNGQELF